MFNNVNQTFNFQDASQEIIIMLLGAFLLGCLLTWLLNKLFNKDYSVNSGIENQAYRYDNHSSDGTTSLKGNNEHNIDSTSSEVRIVERPTNQNTKTVIAKDDLSKITSIDKDIQIMLKAYGVQTFAELRDIDFKDLKEIQGQQKTYKREIETWPRQASLAANGDWKKLAEYQGFIRRIQAASNTQTPQTTQKTSKTKPENSDQLAILEGISPRIEVILNNKEIHTFKQLSHIDSEILKNHIVEADASYAHNETESWPHQAAMAEKEQWEELKIYQDFMHSDTDPKILNQNNKTEQILKNQEPLNPVIHSDLLYDKSVENDINENLSDHDDLKFIEGIGPKIEELLNDSGIYTFSQLQKSEENRLKKILDDAGSQFRMHDTTTWPEQAGMANRSEWDKLKSFKHNLLQDQATKAKSLANNSERDLTDKVAKLKTVEIDEIKEEIKEETKDESLQKDDLKKIEGIGPKIEELLNKGGINTYKQLYDSNESTLRQLLDDAGSQFRMHDVAPWPHQAGMANRSEWDELKSYQTSLVAEKAIKAQNDGLKPTKIDITKNIKDESKVSSIHKNDDLKKIEGIGPKIEELLNKGGINTFKQLYDSNESTLRQLLDDAGSQFRMHDVAPWPHQAGMANRSEWDELKSYQTSLVAEKATKVKNDEVKPTNIDTTHNKTESKVSAIREKDDLKFTKTVTTKNNKQSSKVSSIRKKDNLKKIEGIGPKIEELLNKNNIETYEQLYNSDESTLRQLLDDAGSQFKMHDTHSWPHQAGMASRSEWDELKTYQNSVTKEKTIASGKKDSIVTATSKRKTTKFATEEHKDDLRKIEGIGPKIQELLNNAGIINYKQLSGLSRDTIKELLNQAGPQFRMHEPESWPHQSELADNKEWNELEKYQNYLLNGEA